ncbi:MAG: SGNH/GDSL hydrolase family protein [Peptostreptococcaceae bacterium]|nr:SGNH/GDSL hydrolase family protein [Peptostreptococcaceae bacterium]
MNICVLGDSVARGIVYDEIKHKYSSTKNSFSKIISNEKNLNIKNLAKFGCTIQKGNEILNTKFTSLAEYSYTVLEFGGNDCDFAWPEIADCPEEVHFSKVPTDKFQTYYEEMIKKIKDLGSIPVILTLPPIDSKRFFNWVSKGLNKKNLMDFLGNDVEFIYRWHDTYNKAIIALATKTNTPIIDITKAFLNTDDYSKYLCIDGIHPNDRGHKLIADTILNTVGSYI